MNKLNRLEAIIVGIAIIVVVLLIKSTNNDLEKSKEIMTIECGNQGKVIATFYTNSGDKYYGCKEDSKHENNPKQSSSK